MAKILKDASAAQLAEKIDGFFMRRDRVWETLERLSARLVEEDIPHVVVGGMALVLHGFTRVTGHVDIVTTPDGLAAIHERLVGRGYVPVFQGARKTLRDADTGVNIEIITTGEYPGDGKPKPVSFPDPKNVALEREGFRVIALPKLIELKLASGLSAAHRIRDLADVADLIMALHLPQKMADELDPSVRAEYGRLWQAAQDAQPSS